MNDRLGTGTILHLVLSDDDRAWRDCLACCSAEDTVLLLDAGVMLLAGADAGDRVAPPCQLNVSAADARARGVANGSTAADPDYVSDADVISLIAAHRYCLSWR